MATYRIIFNRKKQLDQEGKALVQIEAYQNGKRRYFLTEVYGRPDQWDVKRHVVKHDALANKRIQSKRQELETFELMFPKIHGRQFTLDDFALIADEQKITNEPEPPKSFSKYLREQLRLDQVSIELDTFSFHCKKCDI
ncbi:Arm DNA-binding domain-containing protein [Larkinella soli]|uniref:Arm DNA-binding domain-containing protein n=1 Tax=Larkinella soli TaxID=1770527 RepID=UPI0019D20671|nr:Arm DNA-binding domain-containing protein [Larkinella soli]